MFGQERVNMENLQQRQTRIEQCKQKLTNICPMLGVQPLECYVGQKEWKRYFSNILFCVKNLVKYKSAVPLFFKSGCSFSFDRSTLYILDTCALKGIWITIYFPTLAFCSFKWLFFDEHVFKTVKYTISFIVSTFLWESCLRNPYYCWDFVSSTSVTSFLSVGFKL